MVIDFIVMFTVRVIALSIVFITTITTAKAAFLTDPDTAGSSARIGLRAGNSTIESYADFIFPYSISDKALVFLNPRFLLGDEGVNQINIGVGARYLFDKHGVVGTNLYYDKRTSPLGVGFNQAGLGLEWLGKSFDVRANLYRANDDIVLVNEFGTEETRTESSSRSSRAVETSSSTKLSYSNAGAVTASGNNLVQTADETATTTTTTKVTTTTTTTTNVFRTQRQFEQFQGALDGWDMEVGYKLPLKIGPEVRLFAGYYGYEDPFENNHQLSGAKARAEIRASEYLTFDAEVYEHERNGSDYFVGFRLAVPLEGKNIWQNFNCLLYTSPSPRDS